MHIFAGASCSSRAPWKKKKQGKKELSRTYVEVREGREELRQEREGRNVKRAVKGGEKNGRRGREGGEGKEKQTRLTRARAHAHTLQKIYQPLIATWVRITLSFRRFGYATSAFCWNSRHVGEGAGFRLADSTRALDGGTAPDFCPSTLNPFENKKLVAYFIWLFERNPWGGGSYGLLLRAGRTWGFGWK